MRKVRFFALFVAISLSLAGLPIRAGEPVRIEEATDAAEMSVKLPVALSDLPEVSAKLGVDAGRQFRRFADRAAEAYKQSSRQNRWRKWSLEIDHEVTFRTPGLVSVLRQTSLYTGGAHGNVGLDSVIYDRESGETLGLDDVFGLVEDGAPVLQAMAGHARKVLTEELAQASDPQWIRNGTAPERATYENFTLVPSTEAGKAGGVAVHFGPYAVAPYAAGPQQVTIPQKVTSNYMKPRWRNVFAGQPATP